MFNFQQITLCLVNFIIMRYILILFTFISFSCFSQFGFDKIDHDFGDIRAGDDRVVDLKFRNTTPDKIYLLRVKHGRQIKTLVSGQAIMPDSLLIIRFKYNPDKKGRFKIEIPVYLSNSMEPFVFTLSGNVKEIDNSMGLDCPRFDNPNAGAPPIFEFKGLVLDAETKEPISNASVTFISNGTISQIEKTNRKGSIQTKAIIGLYYFVIDADGYVGKEFPKYMNKNNDSILVYMKRPIENLPLAESLDTIAKTVFEFPLDSLQVVIPEVKNDTNQLLVGQRVDTIVSEVVLDNQQIEDKVKEKALKINYKSNNIVFLLDVSTSMNSDGKLDLLKSSLIEMVNKLSENDTITLISYSTFSKVIVEGVSAKEKELLTNTIQAIKAQGMTAGGDGMKLAYRQGREHFIEGGNNQVIMATDGKFNKGNMNLDRLVEKNFARGIGLTVLGIKNKPEDAESMEAIAKMGGGRFLLIENYEDSKELLISEIKRTSVVYSR